MPNRRPVLLDISRTISRAGRGPATGIDRVERAYIDWALTRPGSAFLARLARKAALLPAEAMAGLRDELAAIEGVRHWPMARVIPGKLKRDRRAESIVARHAQSVAEPKGLVPALRKFLGGDFAYLNVGHTNLEGHRLEALQDAGARTRIVMIHDVIPLSHSSTQTPASVKTFARRLEVAALHATRLVTSANATAEDVRRFLPGGHGAVTAIPLGVEAPLDVPAHVQERPYFVQLGTVEPRKNTAMLLKAWSALEEPRPELQVIGARGWKSKAIFTRIEAMASDVTHLEGLTDAQITSRLKGARALLFPTKAEGFGFPLFEAVQLGTPVIASDLPVFRELIPDTVLYLPAGDATKWAQEITVRAKICHGGRDEAPSAVSGIPRWADHFDQLEELL